MASKVSVWEMTGVSIVPNVEATGNETALSIHAETVVKNGGKPKSKAVINLTRAHIKSQGFSLSVNESNRTATLRRVEGSRGRKARQGASAADIAAAIKALTA